METLDPRVRVVWAVSAVFTAGIVGVVVTVAVALSLGRWLWVGGLLAALVGVTGFVGAVYRYRRFRFELQDDALFIQRGVLTHVRTVLPFVRVQHVDTQRGPVERTLGLSSVVVYTAGSRQADVRIPGLTVERADRLQDSLREMAVESGGEDAV